MLNTDDRSLTIDIGIGNLQADHLRDAQPGGGMNAAQI
jgi:hypothetical protein